MTTFFQRIFSIETNCDGFSDISTVHPVYSMHEMPAKTLNFHGFSISQLLDGIQKKNFSQTSFANDTVVIGGIEAVKWIGCDNVNENNISVQVLSKASFQKISLSFYNPVGFWICVPPFFLMFSVCFLNYVFIFLLC